MNDAESRFVERVGQLLATGGLPRMAGRMWGWLLICEPPEQTAAQIAERLEASRGAISGAARLLTDAGLVGRTTRRGDRREYFSVPEGSIERLLQSRMPSVVAWRRLSEEGLELLRDRPPEARRRLEEVQAVYAFFERELPAVLERFQQQRAELRADRLATGEVDRGTTREP